MFIRLIANRTTKYEFALVPDHHEYHNDYANALERAHRILDLREVDGRNSADPYGPLATWLLKYLVALPLESDCVEPALPPTWISEVSAAKKGDA